MATIYKCDRCGEEVPFKSINRFWYHNVDLDLCTRCREDLSKTIEDWVIAGKKDNGTR